MFDLEKGRSPKCNPHIFFYFPKAGDMNLLNLLVCFFIYIDFENKCKMQSHSFFSKGGGHKFIDFLI